MPIQLFYNLFLTKCSLDGSGFFGIHGTPDPMWDQRIDYIGNGPRLAAKLKQYPAIRYPGVWSTEVLFTSTDRDVVEERLKSILTPATLADPRCLNVSDQETYAKVSNTLTGHVQTEGTKAKISENMAGNDNSLGHVMPEESRAQLSKTRITAKLKWIHNKKTREELQLTKEEIDAGDMLPGFELGRLPKKLKEQGPVKAVPMSDADRAKMMPD